ncbi:MAG: TlpA family protein disulfide reductase [Neomegalonema sp.]|nr:TlpA family protein disulfide reductase [Neomegalonema sp.]
MKRLGRPWAFAQRQQRRRSGSIQKSLLAFGALVLLSFGALVVAQETPASAPAAAKESAKPATPPAEAAYNPADRLAPVLIGQMRGFQFHQKPLTLPDFSFFGPKGELRDLDAYKGKIVLVNFWALWCAPCLRELPSLDRLAKYAKETLGDDVVVVGVNLDRGDIGRPLAFMSKNKLESIVFLHEPTFSVPTKLKLKGMPTTIMLDRQGREIGVFTGEAEWDSAEAKLLLERAAKLP